MWVQTSWMMIKKEIFNGETGFHACQGRAKANLTLPS